MKLELEFANKKGRESVQRVLTHLTDREAAALMLGFLIGGKIAQHNPKLELNNTINIMGMAFATFDSVDGSAEQVLAFAKTVAAAREAAAK